MSPRGTFLSILALLALGGAQALYSSSDDVVELTQSNFRTEVKKAAGPVLVEFYAPWCGHCKNLAPEWKKAASALNGVVKVAALDATEAQQLAGQYGVQGYPTIKLFVDGEATDYQGGRTAADIVDAGLKAARKLVKGRLSGKSSSSSKSSKSSGSSGSQQKQKSAVVTVTGASFQEAVMNSDEPVMVEFYAPWCGHCKNLAPEWESAAQQLDGQVTLAAVDATAEQELAARYGVQGYPTIKVFQGGEVSDYQGGRTASDIVAYAARLDTGPAVKQLLGPKQWRKACQGQRICVLAALPHILDAGKAGRERQLATLEAAAQAQRGKPFRFFWTEGGAQAPVEEALGMTFGFPALAAVHQDKERFALQRGSFSEGAVGSFLQGLLSGRERTTPLPAGGLAFARAEPWDGEDAQMPEEEPLDPSFFDDL